MVNINMIAERILINRRYKNLTQSELGLKMGYDMNTAKQIINNWECGRRQPTFDHVIKICTALEISLSDFLA